VQHHHHHQPPQPQHHQHYQTPIAVAPAPLQAPAPAPLAPTPARIAAQPPMVAAHGITLPVPAPISYAHPQTHIAPAPAVSVQSGMNTGIAHQVTMAVAKRRRIDVPMVAVSGGIGMPAPPMIADPMAVAAALQGRGRKKTQAQIDRRRERNRILARRTRLRKKFFFESLQKEVVDLQRENAALKEIVRSELADDGQELLTECNASEKLPPAVLEACGENASDLDSQDFNLVRSIQQSQHSFVITDPSLQDNPIVFASDDFLNVTGYAREEVLGRNCRFLQGTETCQTKLDEMRKNLEAGEDVSVTMVNYTADGTPFWNKLFIAALRDSANNVVNFIGVIAKVTSPDADDPEAGKELSEVPVGDDDMNSDENVDASVAAMVADGTVKAIEGAVDAAVAAAPSAVHG
jgi:PAS domain S-box-containing protein